MEEFQWNKKCDRFVVLLDVMGFKDRVYKSSHDEVVKMMESLYDCIYDIKNANGKFNNAVSDLFTSIRVVMFSDSLLLISTGNSSTDYGQIVYLTSWILKHCLRERIPIKGAISFGTFTADFDKSIFVGRPLVDAYLLQEELKYYGVVADCSVEYKMENDPTHFQEYFTQYKTPLKNGSAYHYNLNYLTHDTFERMPTTKDEIMGLLEKFYYTVSGQTRIYVDNTVDFIKFCWQSKSR
jgi:hypothetical protein